MVVNSKTLAKIAVVAGSIASTVIGAIGVATLPNAVRVALVAIGAIGVFAERYLSTTNKSSSKSSAAS